jgi:hypothetical protein
MHSTHRFMMLTNDQNRYFIQEVGNAALSYGITVTDATAVGTALTNLFNKKNSPAVAINAAAGLTSDLQSCCQDSTCTESTASDGGVATPQVYANAIGGPSPMPTTMSSGAASLLVQPYIYLFATAVSGFFLI